MRYANLTDDDDWVLARSTIRSGQPRRYADTERVYQYRLLGRTSADGTRHLCDGAMLMQAVETMYAGLPREAGKSYSDFHIRYLDYMRFTDGTETIVEVRLVEPYVD